MLQPALEFHKHLVDQPITSLTFGLHQIVPPKSSSGKRESSDLALEPRCASAVIPQSLKKLRRAVSGAFVSGLKSPVLSLKCMRAFDLVAESFGTKGTKQNMSISSYPCLWNLMI
jgi:hypothetical protein